MEVDADTLYKVHNMATTPTGQLLTKEEFVARHIREAIVSGRLAPGERIRQQQLADELGMSPTPVREALRGLVTEGWLELKPHVGVSVAEIRQDSIDEVYRLRELLESRLAASAAPKITAAQLRELREINRSFEQAHRANDHGAAREANFKFHAFIWEVAGWPVTAGILNGLWRQAPWTTMSGVKGRERRTLKEHNQIIAALASGDPERAREAHAAHVRSGRADYHHAVGTEPPTED